MKGIVLAGGSGSRLSPLTKVTNKHLLPVWNKPMIYYPINTLINAGIKDILIISGPEHSGHFSKLLSSGKEFGVKFTYEIQDKAGGIAQALSLAEDFVDDSSVAVILGDNIFEDKLNFNDFETGSRIYLKEVHDPERFGVADIKGDKITSIIEKPKNPKSNLAVTGIYIYDSKVFDIIKTLKPSNRGELEITDVNNAYIKEKKMQFRVLEGFWSDAGTFESLFKASKFLKENSN